MCQTARAVFFHARAAFFIFSPELILAARHRI